jgi:CheY-like chemotaxis protein
MDDLSPLAPPRSPTRTRPLLGMTILLVEDSRYACEAMRLMCLHSGARLRRADCLRSARRHLQVYRPSVAIIDLGLPDGSGLELIEELDRARPRITALIGISGDDHSEPAARQAGADGFIHKPLQSIGMFQQAILENLPEDLRPNGPRILSDEAVNPDPVAYRDDMTHVASLLEGHTDGPVLDYIAQFLEGVARSAEDLQLVKAAGDLAKSRAKGGDSSAPISRIAGMVEERVNKQIAI